MSENSPLSVQNEVETVVYDRFIVDFFHEGSDLIYHFYPNPIEYPFMDNFHLLLEEAFVSTLPDNTDVRAQFIENYEMANFERSLRPQDQPHSSFWVRVKELASNPMADLFLKEKLFNNLQELTR